MKKIAIFGSCVTRDAFEFDKNNFILTKYFARSSFASLAAEPKVIPDIINAIPSKFQQEMVKRDMDKSFLDYCKSDDFDYIVFDFIDERLGVYKRNNVAFTCSSEFLNGLKNSSYHLNSYYILNNTNLSKDSLKYKFWKEGLEKIYESIYKNQHKIILNKLYWSDSFSDGSKFGVDRRIQANNDYLNFLYDDFLKTFKTANVIEYPKEILKSNKNHKLGEAPFHYIDEVYLHFLSNLKKIVNKSNNKNNLKDTTQVLPVTQKQENLLNIDKQILKDLSTFRLDFKLENNHNELKIESKNNLSISYPQWFKNDSGQGCIVINNENKNYFNFSFVSPIESKITFSFKGIDKRKNDGSRLAFWTTYKNVIINGTSHGDFSAWHDKPKNIVIPCKKDEKIEVSFEIETYEYSMDELKELLKEIYGVEDEMTLKLIYAYVNTKF